MVCGGLYVATTGVELMPLWPAGSWDIPAQVRNHNCIVQMENYRVKIENGI